MNGQSEHNSNEPSSSFPSVVNRLRMLSCEGEGEGEGGRGGVGWWGEKGWVRSNSSSCLHCPKHTLKPWEWCLQRYHHPPGLSCLRHPQIRTPANKILDPLHRDRIRPLPHSSALQLLCFYYFVFHEWQGNTVNIGENSRYNQWLNWNPTQMSPIVSCHLLPPVPHSRPPKASTGTWLYNAIKIELFPYSEFFNGFVILSFNFELHGAEVHGLGDDAGIPWCDSIIHRKCKKSLHVLPGKK